jgi:hypothetical protein
MDSERIDLVNAYCASSVSNGITYAHTFYAATEEDAIRISELNGWIYDGEVCFEFELDDGEVAMMERDIFQKTEH